MLSFAGESVLVGLRSVPPPEPDFELARALARLASSAALVPVEPLTDWLSLRAASGVAPLVPTAGCVGRVVGLGVDVASLPPVAGWVGGAPVAGERDNPV